MRMTKFLRLCTVVAALLLAGAVLAPRAAHAYGRVGVFFGFAPVVVPPPVYYPAPVYYYPPAYYASSPVLGAPPGFTCYAGRYVCPLAVEHPIGGACACPAENGGRIGGTVR